MKWDIFVNFHSLCKATKWLILFPQLLNFWTNKGIKIQKIGMCICFDSISVFYALWRNPRCALSLLSFEALLRCWGRAGVVSTCTASSVSIQSCWEQHTYTVFCVPRNSEKYLVWHESFSLKTCSSIQVRIYFAWILMTISTLFEMSNFCPKIQFWQPPNIFTPKFFNNFSREIKVVNS